MYNWNICSWLPNQNYSKRIFLKSIEIQHEWKLMEKMKDETLLRYEEDIPLFSTLRLNLIGQDNRNGSGPFFTMYKIFLICWISFGLGYIVMIMTFIARGMRSKKIMRLEHKLAMNLKLTQSKIWNEFNKEVNYLRRVFNELQLSKVKVSDLVDLDQTILSNRRFLPGKYPHTFLWKIFISLCFLFFLRFTLEIPINLFDY